MQWKKHGVVWQPDGSKAWARRHATCPTPLWLNDGTLRLYIQCRDEHNVGRVGYVDVDPEEPGRVIRVSDKPVLNVGEAGCFDDNGVFQTSVLKDRDGRIRMYYAGFELSHRIRYRLLTGLALSEDGGETFHRIQKTPILERSDAEPFFRCGSFVRQDDEGYYVWYVAGGQWVNIEGKAMPVYDLRYLESKDGIYWPDEGRIVLPIIDSNEHGFGRPYVLCDENQYRMFYSIRKVTPNAYRLGYAESDDGIHWLRKDDELGLDVSREGWDSESVEYAAVVETGGRTWMFYNGNDFGGTGFGVAELVAN